MRRALARSIFLWLAVSLVPLSSNAQVSGPLLEQGTLEAGYTYQWVDRTFTHMGETRQADQTNDGAAFRYGLTPLATFSIDLSGDVGEQDTFSYTVGVGLQTSIWTHREFRVTTTILYAQSLVRSRGESNRDWEQSIEGKLVGEYDVQRFTVWAGPSFSYWVLQEYPGKREWTTNDMLGLAAGARFLLFKHLVLQANATWADGSQSQIFAAYQF
jgi:hypothetical protein